MDDKAELKMFADSNLRIDHKKDLEVIKSLFKSLVPTDIKAGLEVYQPLEYSVVPFVPNAIKSPKRFSLDTIIVGLLQKKPIVLGDESAEEKNVAKKSEPGRHNSSFTSPASPIKLLLIQGAAGSGKSLFGWHLCSRYYQHSKDVKEDYAALPIFVPLPMFRSQILSNNACQLLPNYFSMTYGIRDAASLQDQPLVIILDGLDELGSKINLYQACHLHLWRNTTFLLTCRNEFLQDSDVAQFITPTNPVTGTAERSWLGKLYLLPFTAKQRIEYISKFSIRYKDIYQWEGQQYVSALENIPQLGAFLHEPLLLFMVLNLLPQFHLGSFSASDSSSFTSPSSPSSSSSVNKSKVRRLDPYLLEVQPITDITCTYPQFRRAELYALFVDGWAAREIVRLPVDRRPTSQQVLDFCSKLAFEMFLYTQTSVAIIDAHSAKDSPAAPSSRVERFKARKAARSIVSDSWAEELFAEHESERACSPLRKSVERYGFLHKSLQEYFTARHMASDLVDRIVFEESTWNGSLTSSISEFHLSRKRVTSDYAVLRFAAELIDQRTRSYITPSPDSQASDSKSAPADDLSSFQPYGRALFDILRTNRHPVASCNAISILNAAGVGFQGRDFTGLDLSGDIFPLNPSFASIVTQNEQKALPSSSALVPLADLSGANLSGCKLMGANLRGIRLENACLDYADIRGAAMEQTIFGQSSMFLGHSGHVSCLLLSPDGRALFSGSEDKTIHKWSVESGNSIRIFEGHTDHVFGLALSIDGKTLFSCSWDTTIKQWEVETGSLVRVLNGHTSGIYAVILSKDDKTLFSGSDDLTIRFWSVEMGSILRILRGHTAFVWCLTLSGDGQTLYSGSGDKTIREWSVETGSELRVLDTYTDRVSSLVLSPDGKTLFSASDENIREWSLDTGTVARIFQGHSQPVESLCLSRDGRSLFSGGAGISNQLFHWSVESGSFVRVFEGHTDIVYSVALSPVDGATLFSCSADKTIRQWAIDAGALARVAEGHTDYVNTLVLNHSTTNGSKRLYSGARDGTIREWCIESGTLVRVLEGRKAAVCSLALSSDGQTLYSGCEDSSIGQWSVASGSLLHHFQGHSARVECVKLSVDEKIIFSGSRDLTIRSWSVFTRSLIRIFRGHTNVIFSLAVSSNSKVLFSGSYDNTIRQWAVDTGSATGVLKGHNGCVRTLALSSDSQMLYSGSDDTTIRQWALGKGSLVLVLKGHTGEVSNIVLSANEKKLFSASLDTTIRVWSLETGAVECVLEGHSGGLTSLALSADMQTLFSSGGDRSVREWSLSSLPSFSSSSSFSSFSSSSCLQVWSSGPWLLSARYCQLDDSSRLAARSRLLLTQCGAIAADNANKDDDEDDVEYASEDNNYSR